MGLAPTLVGICKGGTWESQTQRRRVAKIILEHKNTSILNTKDTKRTKNFVSSVNSVVNKNINVRINVLIHVIINVSP